jgi:hypothetical protein
VASRGIVPYYCLINALEVPIVSLRKFIILNFWDEEIGTSHVGLVGRDLFQSTEAAEPVMLLVSRVTRRGAPNQAVMQVDFTLVNSRRNIREARCQQAIHVLMGFFGDRRAK